MQGDAEFRNNLARLAKEFAQGLPDQWGAIEIDWIQNQRSGWSPDSLNVFAQKIHALNGAAATLGFEKIAKTSRELNEILQEYSGLFNDTEGFQIRLEKAMQDLRHAAYTDQQIDVAELHLRMINPGMSDHSLHAKRSDRLIYLVEDDSIQGAQLAEQIGYFGYSVKIFSHPSELNEALHQEMPTAILLDISFAEGTTVGFESIPPLRAKFPNLSPIIFITVHDQLPFRLQAVRVGGEAYFTKPVQVDALIEVLDRLILQDSFPPSRVLVVDDSRVQANYIAMQLNKVGISTEVESNPLNVIDHMVSFSPDLLLLDMYMPDYTGMELAKVIRQMEQFISVPIVFLSAETDKEKQLRAMGFGGDDFLVKPIEPDHLISAVITRIERYRKLRVLMTQDSLTGLLNHSTTKERLESEVKRARRQNLPLAYAMIDLDHFKDVNDQFGHATGDRVLKSLAHLLKQRLRSTDGIGRLGGEEFAILFPNTDEHAAAQVMDELREGFARINHYAGENEFSITFSCGVAAYPEYNSPDQLSAAADQALYTAKESGRNQLIQASKMEKSLPVDLQTYRTDLVGSTLNIHSRSGKISASNNQIKINRILAHLSALNNISKLVVKQQTLPGIVAEVTREVVPLFNAQHVGISLLSEDKESLTFIGDSEQGWDENPGQSNRIILAEEPASEKAVKTGKAIFVREALNSPLTLASQPLLQAYGIFHRLIVPLLSHGAILGTMNIDFNEPDLELTPEDIALAENIAGSVASMIENNRLLEAEKNQRQYLETLVENIPVAIVMIDSEASIRSWNPAAEKLFGYTAAEAIGQNVDDLLTTDEYRQEALRFSQESINAKKLIHSITRRRRKDGSLADVELLAVPVITDGKFSTNLAIYHDITDLQRARHAAEAANEAKSAFLATMSHEIRTPLNAVIGMTTLLMDTPLSEEQKEFSDTIRTSSEALLTIINDILDFSKIEAGKMELEEQAFDLRECMESSLDLVTALATQKGIDLAYLIDPGVPLFVISDSTRLRQILLNLLSNAVKFTSEGEVVLSVENHAEASSPEGKNIILHFSVRDSGIGIPPERANLLFRSFSQLDASTTRRFGGTGLGLAISKRLAELMGGEMWVESEGIPGKGSTFHFTIRAQPSTSPVPVFLNQRQPELTGKKILIVDDNATNRYILTRQAHSWGMVPEETADPLQALQWIKGGKTYDLALLDMQMPEMDGAMLAKEIVKLTAGKNGFPIVMLTSWGLKETESGQENFSAFLTKPIKPAVLYSTVLKVMGKKDPLTLDKKVKPLAVPLQTGLHNLRILLAEDTVVNQKVALQLLKKLGYTADLAANGFEVLESLRRQPYDVILMDVQMPEMDGLKAARLVRSGEWMDAEQNQLLNQPHIIAMTANAMQGDREICLAAGMDDYISKPIHLEELRRALETASANLGAEKTKGPDEIGGSGKIQLHTVIDEPTFQKFLRSMEDENPEFLASLIQDYLEETPRLLNELNQAAEAENYEMVRLLAHAIKSSSLLFGALGLADLAKKLEQNPHLDLAKGEGKTIQEILEEYQAVEKILMKKRSEI